MIFKNNLCTWIASLTLSLVINTYADETYTWDSLAIGGGGFVSAVVPSKAEQGLIYARTDVGGAYRWDKTSERWIALTDWVAEDQTGFLGVESIALDPQNAANVYMLVGISYFNNGKTALLRSNNYGKTFSVTDVSSQFKAHGNGMGRQNGEKLQVDPANSNILYTGTRWNGLFKSSDAGATWSHLSGFNVTTTPNENGVSFVLLDPSSASGGSTQKIFAGVSRYSSIGGNFYRSNDGGLSFTEITGGPTGLMPQRAVMAKDGNIFITFANGAGPHGHWNSALNEPMDKGQVWKFNPANNTWTNVTPAGITRPFAGISVDPDDANRVVLSTINTYLLQYGNAYGDRIYITTDGGANWTDVVARGFTLDTKNVSWINGHAIHWAGSIEFDPFNTKTVLVTSGNGIFKTADIDAVPTTWAFNVAGLEETVPLNLVSVTGGPLVSVIGDYDGFRHTDITQYAPIHTPRMGSTSGLDIATLDTNMMVRVGDKPEMYYSTDKGLSWIKTASMNGKGGQVAFAADGKTLLHSPQDSTTSYYSTDLGSSWAAVVGLNVTSARPVADPINKNKIYALNGNNMMISTNSGLSFAAAGTLSSANGSKVIRVAPGKEGDIWVALYSGGLARSTNSGAAFSAISGVTYAGAVGFGKAAEGASYPTVFIWGTVNGVLGIYRSTDTGATWVRVNDDAHEYGGPANGQFIVGDMNTFGVVYMSTAGRGIIYGKPASGVSSSAATSSSSSSVASFSSSSSANSISSSASSSASSLANSSSSSSAVPVNNSGASSGGGGGAIDCINLLFLFGLAIVIRFKTATTVV
jgi:xyloglucan-specific exo-beta-1,4-glucanase